MLKNLIYIEIRMDDNGDNGGEESERQGERWLLITTHMPQERA